MAHLADHPDPNAESHYEFRRKLPDRSGWWACQWANGEQTVYWIENIVNYGRELRAFPVRPKPGDTPTGMELDDINTDMWAGPLPEPVMPPEPMPLPRRFRAEVANGEQVVGVSQPSEPGEFERAVVWSRDGARSDVYLASLRELSWIDHPPSSEEPE